MLLCHGTSAAFLPKIMSEGLKPRGRKKGNFEHTVESHPECVYLTNAYAAYFAGANRKDAGAALIEVDTDMLTPWHLSADEDAVEQLNRNRDDLDQSWDMKTRTEYYRERLFEVCDGEPFAKYDWETSLRVLGNCCHYGTIPVEAITRVCVFDEAMSTRLMFAVDPTISVMNYSLMGDFYRNMQRWFFDENFEPEWSDIGQMMAGQFPPDMDRNLWKVSTREEWIQRQKKCA